MTEMTKRRDFIRQSGWVGLGVSTLGMAATSPNGIGGQNNDILSPKYSSQNASGHWNVFDANCVLGRHLKLGEEGLHTSEDLLSEMDHYGIAESLVLDSLSKENFPLDGNQRIIVETRNHKRLHRAWSIVPTWKEETNQSSTQFVNSMVDNNIKAVFLFPNQYFFKLSDWCIDEIIEPLAQYKVPVFINPTEANGKGAADATNWDEVIALCKRWPQLPVIVSENRIRRSQRLLYKAFDSCPNLHIELSALWLHRGIEYISEKWGAHRILFGSGWPGFGHHMTLTNLTTAQISNDNKKLIAGDNLRKLLSWNHPIETVKVEFPPPADEYVAYGRSGIRPKKMTFFDIHGHLGEYNAHYHVPNSQIERVVEDIQYYGLEKVCVFSFAGVYSDEKFGNDIVIEASNEYSSHLIGFTLLNPLRGEKEMIKELERGHKNGMKGIKLIPSYQGYPVEGRLIEVACKWAHAHRQIIINHYWGSSQQMEKLVSKYTNACFVTAHTTIAYAEVMRKYSNLFVCSVPLLTPRACEEVVEAIGADRFLFGTDLLDLPIGWGLGPILFARLNTAQKKMILGENLKKILKNYSV